MISALALTLVIHVTNLAGAPAPVVSQAQIEVVEMLGEIGVTIEWAADGAPALADAVRLTLLPDEVGSLRQNLRPILGAATRTALGTRVAWVFYNRVAEESNRYLVPPSRVLACTIAHEIGHLLQDVPSHDEGGLMRGVWTAGDFRRASAGRLRFASTFTTESQKHRSQSTTEPQSHRD